MGMSTAGNSTAEVSSMGNSIPRDKAAIQEWAAAMFRNMVRSIALPRLRNAMKRRAPIPMHNTKRPAPMSIRSIRLLNSARTSTTSQDIRTPHT